MNKTIINKTSVCFNWSLARYVERKGRVQVEEVVNVWMQCQIWWSVQRTFCSMSKPNASPPHSENCPSTLFFYLQRLLPKAVERDGSPIDNGFIHLHLAALRLG
jgi:hypothetical protein